LGIKPKEKTEVLVSAAEFVLEDCMRTAASDARKSVFAADKQAKRVEKPSQEEQPCAIGDL